MSTPEEPPQLTRRQLRELRNTAANQIITEPPAPAESPVVAPLPRAAEPVELPTAPSAAPPTTDGQVLTRRDVRQRERLRTASVPVITAEVLAAHAAETAETAETAAQEPPAEEPPVAEPATAEEEAPAEAEAEAAATDDVAPTDLEPEVQDEDATVVDESATQDDATAVPEERRVIAPDLGAEILRGEPSEVEVPASFDQLLTRGSTATGALSMPNALILSQTPDSGPFVSPVTATGEVLITGTFSLPDTYGSTGSVPGTADGRDADAVLIDGELPAASSPTPIAASAAISTIKSADEIIKPPAPEKGSRLMVVLAITAGVLAVALAGVLIVAITTGVF